MPRIVLLTVDTKIGRIAANYLAARFPNDLAVVVERRFSRFALLQRRIRRFGIVRVAGQLGFMGLQLVQNGWSRRRIAATLKQSQLENRWPAGVSITRVLSVNDAACVALLQRAAPSVILVVGTRLIDAAVLAAIKAPFINYHAGITPKYRGAHGAYWSQATGDAANCGITVHLVDAGIDTGDILYQERLVRAPGDNFSVYPYRQLAAALPLLERAAQDTLAGTLKPHKVGLPSRLWSHPTLWGYVWTGLHLGVW
jgi:folate-dependent phosphoribosylglycinamide formyltransferase PurN